MKPLRWFCLASFLVGLVGCGSGSSSSIDNPAGAKAAQQRADKIEAFKKKAASKPGRRAH